MTKNPNTANTTETQLSGLTIYRVDAHQLGAWEFMTDRHQNQPRNVLEKRLKKLSQQYKLTTSRFFIAPIGAYKMTKTSTGTKYRHPIKAWQARNYNGTPAGWKQGTPDGERDVVEVMFVPDDETLPTTYSNYW
jgi:hypothetical protein